MNFNDYFDPIDIILQDSLFVNTKGQLFSSVKIHTTDNNIKGVESSNIAIIGVLNHKDSLEGLIEIREKLYSLTNFQKQIQIYDLGNLKPGNTKNDLSAALRDVVLELILLNVIPIIIGSEENILYPNYMAYNKLDKKINLVSVDSRIRLNENREKEYKSPLWKIIVENNNSLFSYYNLGYQTHFVSSQITKYIFDQLHFAYRLGYIRSKIKEVEPIFRDADLIGFNIASVRQSDAFGQENPSPNGYYGEEICQLARYAGMSPKISSFNIYDYELNQDINNQTAHLIAQIIWYFIDGYINKIEEYPIDNSAHYKKFIVNLDSFEHELIFYKSEKTNRWWVEVPYINVNNQKQILISCTYEDYIEAGNGEVPQRWLKSYQKIN